MGLLDNIGAFLSDEENQLNLASGFNNMSGNPNAGNIQAGINQRLKGIGDNRKLKAATGLEADKLKRQTALALQLLGDKYPDISNLLKGGLLTPKEAMDESKKPPAERNMFKGADSFNYYTDDKSRVLPDAVLPPKSEGAAIDGYRLAQEQGYKGTWNDYKTAITKAGASRTEVSYGGGSVQAAKPDKGMQNVTDTEGYISQVPISGGIVDIDTQKQVATAEQAVKVIDEALNHAGLSAAVGPWDARTPNVLPDAIAFEALHNQIKGKAFLAAFESLKGGGQITEVEGLKAEQAMARLEMAQDEVDYKKALTDLKDIIEASMARGKGILKSIPTSGQSSDNDPMGIR